MLCLLSYNVILTVANALDLLTLNVQVAAIALKQSTTVAVSVILVATTFTLLEVPQPVIMDAPLATTAIQPIRLTVTTVTIRLIHVSILRL